MPIRILIADDHTLFRRGLASLLAEVADFEVVGEAGDGPAAIRLVARVRPDVVLMDIHMPGGSGVEAVQALSSTHPDLPVIMLTVSENDADLLDAVQAGAQGYFLKNADVAELTNGIRRVMTGHPVLHQALTEAVFRQLSHPVRDHEEPTLLSPLSLRETEILGLVAEGCTNREIAGRLYLSENTIKTHLRRILEKLEVSSRSQAATLAIQRGWLGQQHGNS